jgi:alpha-tubulin suppressor-like RCC1 family protein
MFRFRRVALVALSVVLAAFGLAGIGATPAVASTATWSSMPVKDAIFCCGIGGGPLNVGGGYRLDKISCGSATNCVAIGADLNMVGSPDPFGLAIRWDGHRWSDPEWLRPDPNGAIAQVFDVSCGSPTFCAVVGKADGAFIDVWDGTSWTVAENSYEDASRLDEVSCVSATSCVALGTSGPDNVVQTWNGTTWATTPSNIMAEAVVSGLSCTSATACTAVGSYQSGGVDQTLIETWNGSTWTVVASPNQGAGDNSLSGLSCPSVSFCSAVGTYSGHTLVEHFDGSAWTIVTSPNPGVSNRLKGVTCESSSHCIAVGDRTLIIDWNGTEWSADTSGQGNVFLGGVTCAGSPSLCLTAGSYDDQSVTQMYVLARNSAAPGVPTAVSAVAADRSALVSWTAPASPGALPISGYTVRAYQGAQLVAAEDFDETASTAAINGLTNGASYRFVVEASNAAATSAPSALSAAVIPLRTSALETGETHACVITSPAAVAGSFDTVKCWGQGTAGDLGNGSTANQATPVTVTGLSGVKDLAVGAAHTCALLSAGTVTCWGSNASGQLGDGTTTNRLSPVTVTGLSGVASIDAGDSSTCAVLTNGTMKCWGLNNNGQLGDGTTTNRVHPVAISGLTQVATTSGSAGHRCAVLTTHAIRCWGLNNFGQVGDGSKFNRRTPVALATMATSVQGVVARGTHTCALVTGARVKCWGQNNHGQLGDATTTASRATPAFVSNLVNANLVGGGADTTCARLTSGATKCWGLSNFGQVGDGKYVDRRSPVANTMLAVPVTLPGGATYMAARTAAGGIRTWGRNNFGQLGSGNTTTRPTSGAVIGLS